MAAKKSKEEFKRRSIAAKKGWKKRKAKERAILLAKKQRDTNKRKKTLNKLPQKYNKIKGGKKTEAKIKKLEAEIKALRKKRKKEIAEYERMNRAAEEVLTLEALRGEKARKEITKAKDQIAEADFLKTFENADEMGWFTRGGRKALRYSKLRTLDNADQLYQELVRFKDEPNEFRELAEDMAGEYDCEVSEVYEFFFS